MSRKYWDYVHRLNWAWERYEERSDLGELARAVAEDPDLLAPAKHYPSLLHTAVECGDRSAIDWLLAQPWPFATIGGSSSAYLCAAVVTRDPALVDLVLGWGLSLDDHDDGYPPLRLAIDTRDWPVITRLLDAGADPNVHFDGQTLLQCAARTNDVPLIERLVESGARVDMPDQDVGEETALMVAAQCNATEAALALWRLGASKTVRSRMGRNASEMAAQAGHRKLAALLEP